MNFETPLENALQRHLTEDAVPSNLRAAIRYSLMAPGKRIRPRLCMAAGKMLDVTESASISFALALEMIHCFTLIHDDLPCMDDDDFRRGKPSNHKIFGESLALLAGDALMALALDCAMEASDHSPAAGFHRALKYLLQASGPRGVIGGQAAEALLNEDSTLADLRRMHAGKTGALFNAALLVPMALAEISGDSIDGKTIVGFASELGLAFQVADDLDDAESEKDDSGNFAPTSVLRHQSAEQAARLTHAALSDASQALSTRWGDRAGPLCEIANEVLRSLTSHFQPVKK